MKNLTKPPLHLIIVRTSALGDILHTLPAFAALHEKYPEHRIHWVVESQFSPLLEGLTGLDTVIPVHWRFFAEALQKFQLKKLFQSFQADLFPARRLKPSCAIVFQSLFRSAFLAWKIGSQFRLGFRDFAEGGRLFLTHRVAVNPAQHAILKNLSLLQPLGINPVPRRVPLHIPEKAWETVYSFLEEYQLRNAPYVVICPASSKKVKEWTVAGYCALADRLVDSQNLLPIIAVGPGEENQAKAIQNGMKRKGIICSTFDLLCLSALFKKAIYVVGCDSGSLHLASAMGTPVVGLYGPTDPTQTGPFWKPNRIVQYNPACNRKCYSQRNRAKEPCDCMRKLPIELVLAACQSLFEEIFKAGLII